MNSNKVRTAATGVVVIVMLNAGFAATAELDYQPAGFTDRYCSSCHNDVDKEGGLDLTSLALEPADPEKFARWVKIHDRVVTGEMPPREKKRPAAAELKSFVAGLAGALDGADRAAVATEGRATRRRMNRSEYENTLRDIFQAPYLRVQSQLPEDGEAFRFNKVSSALDVSYVHMARYMTAAEDAMRQVINVRYERPPPATKRYYARDVFAPGAGGLAESNVATKARIAAGALRSKFPVLGFDAEPEVYRLQAPFSVGASDPEKREREAVGWVHGQYAPTGISFAWTQRANSNPDGSSFVAPAAGRYRLRFSGYTLWVGPFGYNSRTIGTGEEMRRVEGLREWHLPDFDDVGPGRRDEPVIIYSRNPTSIRRLGAFDLTPEPTVHELDVFLLANDTVITDAARLFRSRPTGFRGGFTNPLAQKDGQPAVAFRWMEVEGPLDDQAIDAGYRTLFGDLPLQPGTPESGIPIRVVLPSPPKAEDRDPRGLGRRSGRDATFVKTVFVDVVPRDAEADADRLLRAFVERVYRRPVAPPDLQRFRELIRQRMGAGLGFAASMLAGYTAVLSSPQFVYLDEAPGQLDGAALATRLALFLWNSEPDAALRARAARGELADAGQLRLETERMLRDPRAERFIDAFLDYWIEIRKIEDTSPSTTLYNDYYLDDALTEATLDESRLFFAELLQRDLPARNIVDADFTYLNERLATHYDIPGVAGVSMRRVALPAGSVRGGFLTHASVLKVTANGTTTSPVVRGKWIMERIVGIEIPPPPAAVPAVEPDIRGAVTIRQQLDKHRADESCATCHRKIDPPGLALESFDVFGGWRDRYRGTAADAAPAAGFGKNGWPYAFYHALQVDSSGELPDGRRFRDVNDFKAILLEDEAQLARALARHLSVYATGSPVRFSDRREIEEMLNRLKPGGYGVRSLVHEIVQSAMFRSK